MRLIDIFIEEKDEERISNVISTSLLPKAYAKAIFPHS